MENIEYIVYIVYILYSSVPRVLDSNGCEDKQ